LAVVSGAIVVVGVGSIGERHLRNLRSLGELDLHAVDPEDAARSRAEALGATTHRSLESALAVGPRAVLVCTPPVDHIRSVRAAIAAGAHIFVEKPISHELDGVTAAIEEAAARRLVLAVGYNLRFHRGLRTVKDLVGSGAIGRILSVRAEFGQDLASWRPARDYRESYSARRALGGGILLDASHEIDYVRWLAGEITEVSALTGHVSQLDIDVEDIAVLVMTLEGGALAEIHLDCIQVDYSRSCKVIGAAGTVTWDWRQGVDLITATGRKHIPIDGDADPMYVDELRSFLARIDGEATPIVSGEDGRRALEVVIAAKRSAAERRTIAL
jgi:predicted dehydrogenase